MRLKQLLPLTISEKLDTNKSLKRKRGYHWVIKFAYYKIQNIL